ncbi:hypothetical protein [Rhodopseudomonas sp. AAP120]|uniref:hypothetical protein n=1 Tax=Rhodopseudomonas sp. AAP120 TaxID=1523430 RepID=UPI0009EB2D62|nr:hypothetical protein [Rhodopseudomonas sp. AAP120]
MSMEVYVLSDQRLQSIDAWQRAIDVKRDSLRVGTETPFLKVNGMLPVMLNGRQTCFECQHWSARSLMADFPKVSFGHRWAYALAFRWGGNIASAISANLAAAAYAEATRGQIFICAEGKLVLPARAREIAAELERNAPMIEEMVRQVAEQFRRKAGSGT